MKIRLIFPLYLNWQLVTSIVCSTWLHHSNTEALQKWKIIAEMVIPEIFSSKLQELSYLLNNSARNVLNYHGFTEFQDYHQNLSNYFIGQ